MFKTFFRHCSVHTLLLVVCVVPVLLTSRLEASTPELRGVWVAWAGANIPSKAEIAALMEDVAEHNLNTVYVDVWRYGYPYFLSETFYRHTGKWTDPALTPGRDVLEDMIAEGHRHGLHVHAWFEYGFVACQGAHDDLYEAHPDWFARSKDGSVLFNGDYRYKWFSHVHPDAQQFIIDLCQEVVRNYDIDGLELDRIRYPELDCGYDSTTKAIYAAEHNGQPPPNSIWDSGWRRWRADKLAAFMATFYDSIKALDPMMEVSNAPIVYPYGYDNFCQDWRPWFNDTSLDHVSPQVYRASNATYASELRRQLGYADSKKGFFPGLTSIANSYLVPTEELIAMVRTTRQEGLDGHVIWYYNTVADDLPALREAVYDSAVPVPGKPADWRLPAIIVNETDERTTTTGTWTPYTTLSGFEDGCLYLAAGNEGAIHYDLTPPRPGRYELYHYNIYHWNAEPEARFLVSGRAVSDTFQVDMSIKGRNRWMKVGDLRVTRGSGPVTVTLTHSGASSHILFADAVMLLNSNRQEPITSVGSTPEPQTGSGEVGLALSIYPNPVNSVATASFTLPSVADVTLELFNSRGQEIQRMSFARLSAGRHEIAMPSEPLSSGLYFVRITAGSRSATHKVTILK